ncbi:MAG: hypothetical protein AAF693_07695 [Bacteroidota bacterium]
MSTLLFISNGADAQKNYMGGGFINYKDDVPILTPIYKEGDNIKYDVIAFDVSNQSFEILKEGINGRTEIIFYHDDTYTVAALKKESGRQVVYTKAGETHPVAISQQTANMIGMMNGHGIRINDKGEFFYFADQQGKVAGKFSLEKGLMAEYPLDDPMGGTPIFDGKYMHYFPTGAFNGLKVTVLDVQTQTSEPWPFKIDGGFSIHSSYIPLAEGKGAIFRYSNAPYVYDAAKKNFKKLDLDLDRQGLSKFFISKNRDLLYSVNIVDGNIKLEEVSFLGGTFDLSWEDINGGSE